MISTVGYAAKHSFSRLKVFEFEREDARANVRFRYVIDMATLTADLAA